MPTAEACALTPRLTSGPFHHAFDQVDEDVDLTPVTGHGVRAEGRVIRVLARVHAPERSRAVIGPQRGGKVAPPLPAFDVVIGRG